MNKTPKILVVDDEMMIHIILGPLIQSYGFEPIRATSAEMAEQQLRQHAPDLILLDIMIPDSDGSMALLQSIRNNPSLQDSLVVMISGSNNLDFIASYITAGADDYVLKPFHAIQLKTRIMHALERVRKRQSNRQVQKILSEMRLKLENVVEDNAEVGSRLSHDLNNVLTGISISSHLMIMGENQSNMDIEAAERAAQGE